MSVANKAYGRVSAVVSPPHQDIELSPTDSTVHSIVETGSCHQCGVVFSCLNPPFYCCTCHTSLCAVCLPSSSAMPAWFVSCCPPKRNCRDCLELVEVRKSFDLNILPVLLEGAMFNRLPVLDGDYGVKPQPVPAGGNVSAWSNNVTGFISKVAGSLKSVVPTLPAPEPVWVALSKDHAALEWRSLENVDNKPKSSGRVFLASISEVKQETSRRLNAVSNPDRGICIYCRFVSQKSTDKANSQRRVLGLELEAQTSSVAAEWVSAVKQAVAILGPESSKRASQLERADLRRSDVDQRLSNPLVRPTS